MRETYKLNGKLYIRNVPKELQFISSEYLKAYSSKNDIDWRSAAAKLRSKAEFTAEDFEYYLIASSLYSSKIEGNTLDANSFYRNRGKKDSLKSKEVREIEDLADAYRFASENKLGTTNFLRAHKMLSQTFLPAKERGAIRKHQIGVRDSKTLRPVYLAIEPELVIEALTNLFADIDTLLKRKLSAEAIFYYASIIHLWVAVIHPYGDGNGRSARLAEKWFLVSKLGPSAWSINSEQYYWDNRPAYYQNIALGYNYYALHWDRCIPFLLMLPQALVESL